MIYRRKRAHDKTPGGYFSLEQASTKSRLLGYGYGEYIVIRDEFNNRWRGSAERADNDMIHYTFRDDQGQIITGVSDQFGILLRDGKGKIWRGFVD